MSMLFIALVAVLMLPLSCRSSDSGSKAEIVLQFGPPVPAEGSGADMKALPADIRAQTVEILKKRLSDEGYKGSEVKETGGDDILVTVPSSTVLEGEEVSRLVRILIRRGVFEFKEQSGASKEPEWVTVMDGSRIDRKSVVLSTSSSTAMPELSFSFEKEGAEMLAEITTRNKGKKLGIFLDGQLLTSPTVMETIKDGKVMISGPTGSTESEYREWANCLKQPPLPVVLTIKRAEVKGPKR
jgi:preprotein translocase subunit SecD